VGYDAKAGKSRCATLAKTLVTDVEPPSHSYFNCVVLTITDVHPDTLETRGGMPGDEVINTESR